MTDGITGTNWSNSVALEHLNLQLLGLCMPHGLPSSGGPAEWVMVP
jgi:hypothetical protein